MKKRFYKQCWFWLMCIFIVMSIGLMLAVNWFFPNLCRTIFTEILWEIISTVATVCALLFSVHIFKDEREREIKRATLTDFREFQRRYINIHQNSCTRLKTKYLREIERFAVGVNDGAYDIDIINKMSGGMLVGQYKKFMKEFVDKKRKENFAKYISDEQLYCEYEMMIEELLKYRSNRRENSK